MRLTHRLIIVLVLILGISSTQVVFATSSITSITSDTLQGSAVATANTLVNVRAGPGTGFWVIGVLNPLESVPITGVSPDGLWWYVNTRFGMGWVATIAVTPSNTAGVPVQNPGQIVTVTAAQLYVRGGPGEAAIQLGLVTAGSQLFLLGRSADGSWLNVRSQFGENTWVAARFTSLGDAAAPPNSTASLPVTEAETFAIVNAGSLNVRAGPGVNYEIIGTVLGGERLPIIGRNEDRSWYNVQTVVGTGWVSSLYVIERNEFGNAPITTSGVDPATFTGPTAIINTGSLNVRSGDAASFTVLGVVQGGDQFQILGRNAQFSWVLIRTPQFDGWVNRIYVLIRGDTTTLPILNAGTPLTVTNPAAGTTTQITGTQIGPVAFVATGALNIRSGPNIAFASLGSVLSTTRMPIIGQSPDGRWWQVESPFGIGWVNKSYVLVEGDASNVPTVQ